MVLRETFALLYWVYLGSRRPLLLFTGSVCFREIDGSLSMLQFFREANMALHGAWGRCVDFGALHGACKRPCSPWVEVVYIEWDDKYMTMLSRPALINRKH
jgi:hypothetical protein